MTRATLTILAALTMTAGVAHAGKPAPANNTEATTVSAFNCDYGDYHLLLVGEKGAATIKVKVCEFAECQNNDLTEIKLLNLTADGAVYDTSTKYAQTNLVLKYTGNELVEANTTSGKYVTEYYNQCRRLN